MAEIYSSSEASSHSALSPEAADHIHSVLSDLGLSGSSGTDASSAGMGATDGEAAPATHVAAADPSAASAAAPHPVDTSAAAASASGGEFHIPGLADDAASATNAGHAVAADVGGAASHAATGADSIPGGSDVGHPAVAAADHDTLAGSHDTLAGSHDTLAGGNGMDTLWGSAPPGAAEGGDAGAHAASRLATAAGGETLPASGVDTFPGAHAHLADAPDPATLHAGADTLQAHGTHDTLDGSAATYGSAYDVNGHHSTIIGGSGNDTLAQHDASGATDWSYPAHADHGSAGWTDGHATLAGGTGGDDASGWTVPESVVGGDGSDIYAMAHHYGAGYDTADGGTGYESAGAHAYAADAHFASDPGTTIVSFGDGYGAHGAGIDHIQSHDTVYNI